MCILLASIVNLLCIANATVYIFMGWYDNKEFEEEKFL